MTVTLLMLLTGCQTAYVSNPNPAPYYPSCDTIHQAGVYKNGKWLCKPGMESVCLDLKNMTVVMEVLNSLEPSDEKTALTKCMNVGSN